ncbi:hypothetical protein [Streptomyces sp. NPDC058398]|uniref:hypothetical protein n=1 Tax=Streptomyces sp. NPDC058398 TaxID=3346479 RepID=UPI0036570359
MEERLTTSTSMPLAAPYWKALFWYPPSAQTFVTLGCQAASSSSRRFPPVESCIGVTKETGTDAPVDNGDALRPFAPES